MKINAEVKVPYFSVHKLSFHFFLNFGWCISWNIVTEMGFSLSMNLHGPFTHLQFLGTVLFGISWDERTDWHAFYEAIRNWISLERRLCGICEIKYTYYSHVSFKWIPLIWTPRYMDIIFGDKLGKYLHFRLINMDNSHYEQSFGGTKVSILTRHRCINKKRLFIALSKVFEPRKKERWNRKCTKIATATQ